MKMKITILGGAGFIGHNMSLFFKQKGYKVQIIDSLGVNNIKSKSYMVKSSKKIYNKIFKNRLSLFKKIN